MSHSRTACPFCEGGLALEHFVALDRPLYGRPVAGARRRACSACDGTGFADGAHACAVCEGAPPVALVDGDLPVCAGCFAASPEGVAQAAVATARASRPPLAAGAPPAPAPRDVETA